MTAASDISRAWHAAQRTPKVSLLVTLRRIVADYRRTCQMMGASASFSRRLFWIFAPSVVALALYRIGYFCFTHRMRFIAWPLYLLNLYLTGAEIPPSSVIGERCFIGHVRGTIICGVVGDDATLHGSPNIGGGVARDDDGRPAYGLPVIGNDVTIGVRALVLGAVHIGDGCKVGPAALVLKDMPAGSAALSRPSMLVNAVGRNADVDTCAETDEP